MDQEKTLGQVGYEAFCEAMLAPGHVVPQDSWERVPLPTKAAWEAAADAIRSEVQSAQDPRE